MMTKQAVSLIQALNRKLGTFRMDVRLTGTYPLGRRVAYASSCGLDNSPGFDAKPVVHRDSQTLLAADVALRRLY